MSGRLTRTPFDNLPLVDPGIPDLRSIRTFLWWLAKGQARILVVGTFFGSVSLLCAAVTPGFFGHGIQAIADRNSGNFRFWIIMIILLGVVQALTGMLRHQRAVANFMTTISRLQQLVSQKAVELGADLPRLISTGEISAVNSNDVEKVARAYDMVPRLVGAILSFILVAFLLISSSPKVGLMVVIGVPLLALMIAPIIKPLQRRETFQREKLSKASSLAADIVAGLRILRGIGGEDVFLQRFRDASQEVRQAAVKTSKMRALLDGLQVLLPGALIVGVIGAGGVLVSHHQMKVGNLLAFYGYSAFLTMPLHIMTEGAQRVTTAVVATKRVMNLLKSQPLQSWGKEVAPSQSVEIFDRQSGVRLQPFEFVGIVCDNSTTGDELCDRLGGYIDADQVFIGEKSLSSFSKVSIRSLIFSHEKEPAILSGTVASHFAVANSGRLTITEAMDAASADEILDSLEGEGLSSELVERGRTLSGGQRQRLTLARSFFVDAPVLILDDPTSAVDAHTESRIAKRLADLRRGMCTAVITNSPLILDQVSRVIVVVSGRVIDEGSHIELLKRSEKYQELVVRGE
jgi:ABC-type multidrug transport system fused ATPase/permease subunit